MPTQTPAEPPEIQVSATAPGPLPGSPGTMAAGPQRTTRPRESGKRRHVVVVPSLWTPFHHRRAVSALVAFVAQVPPAGIVFTNAPTDAEAREAFVDTLAGFRAVYPGVIGVHGDAVHADLAGYDVTDVAEQAEIVPGWAVTTFCTADPPQTAHAGTPGGNLVCGGTGRLRLAGRAAPGEDGTVRAWLVFECGTLAADQTAGTLGFGLLDVHETTVSARPVRIDPEDGSFTVHGVRYRPRE